MHKHFPVNCILPPHILTNIATKGTDSQKDMAVTTLKLSAQMRGQRRALSDFTAAAFRVAVGGKERIVYAAPANASLCGGQAMTGPVTLASTRPESAFERPAIVT